MPSALLTLSDVVVDRLRASPNIGVAVDMIRSSHRIPVSREQAPAVHVKVDGISEPRSGRGCVQRDLSMVVAIVVRDDEALDAADPLLQAVIARLASDSVVAPAYPAGVRVKLGRAYVNEESADADAMRIDIEYAFTFSAGEESLDIT